MIKIIPAIDIKGGKVVRLIQGQFEQVTVYSDSPVDVARKWALPGVDLIHVVDLDGALEGRPKNLDIVREMAKSISPKIELGGGMRDEDAIKTAFDCGVERVVIGTMALDNEFLHKIADEFKERLAVGIDAREGIVHTKGWVFRTGRKVTDLVKVIEGYGIKTINYTDISKDGTLEGPNIASINELLEETNMDVVASGGVSSMDDIRKLKALNRANLVGVIIGKALYENMISLDEAIRECSR